MSTHKRVKHDIEEQSNIRKQFQLEYSRDIHTPIEIQNTQAQRWKYFKNEDFKAIQDRVKFYRSHGYSGAISMERAKADMPGAFHRLAADDPKSWKLFGAAKKTRKQKRSKNRKSKRKM